GIELRSTNRQVTALHRLLNRLGPLRPLRNRVLGRQAGRMTAGYDLFVMMAYAIPVECQAARGVVLCQFPYRLVSARELDGDQAVVVKSEAVPRRVREARHGDAGEVHPPMDGAGEHPDELAEERLTLSVGRLVGGGHVKRQDLMVESFRRLL